MDRNKVIALYKKYNKIIADIDDTTQENRTKRMIAVLALEIADALLEPEKCTAAHEISASAMDKLREIAAIPLPSEFGTYKTKRNDLTVWDMIKICREIVKNPMGDIDVNPRLR
jgi:hypothetical protein